MKISSDGVTLWYGTNDAPAPDGGEESRSGVSLTVAAQPANPANSISVRYQVDKGPVQDVRGVLWRTDFAENTQYFRATFPDFWSGQQVEYVPILSCGGRRVPAAAMADGFLSSFRLSDLRPAYKRALGPGQQGRSQMNSSLSTQHYPVKTDYIATIAVPLKKPEIVGETPDGLKVNWFLASQGTAVGPNISAVIRTNGGDWMTIRKDGIGEMDVRVMIEVSDGALIYASYTGVYDMGPDGYDDFLNNRAKGGSVRAAPRLITASPKYAWVNRAQFLAVGEVNLTDLVYHADYHVVR